MQILPVLLKDGYKTGHIFQFPDDTTMIYSNFTPRASRVPGVDGVITFGMQYFVQEYLINQFSDGFFERPLDDVMKAYKRRINNYLGPGSLKSFDHIADLHKLGYLPLLVKAIPEGTLVPFRVPVFTIRNTIPEFFWLTNMLETLLSNVLWLPSTSATTAFRYRRVFEKYAHETGAAKAFVPWQGHDFSFRGLPGIEAACLSGAAHLLSFTGTDTIPAIDFLEQYYFSDSDKELIGGSVAATEHSVMCVGKQEGELETFKRLITKVYPAGIVSIVSDTWDFWKVLTEYLPALHSEIVARDGKVVIRPDSGDPVKIICGDPNGMTEAQQLGAIRLLWHEFGGTITEKGYKQLNEKVGLIYGDSITPERQIEILNRLKANGFASSNVVLGIGSYTYQYVTRDTYGFAMKATYDETVSGGPQAIFKKPATDDGVKNSARGLLHVDCVGRGLKPPHIPKNIYLVEDCSAEDEKTGLLQTVFRNGIPDNQQSLADIRARIEAQL